MSIDPAIYNIYEAAQQTGWKGNLTELAEALRKINLGFPAQDEFCLLISWLGRCRLIHAMSQRQYPPTSSNHVRVPDLLAIFDTDAGPIPALIEVKSKNAHKLVWRPDYYESLAEYGRILRLPVLVAWKNTLGNFWTLVGYCPIR